MSHTTEHAIQVMNDCREASIIARAETLKEIIDYCETKKELYQSGEKFFAFLMMETKCKKLLNAIK